MYKIVFKVQVRIKQMISPTGDGFGRNDQADSKQK